MKRVAVIGGGIGGMTAAGLLARQGHSVTLFEGSDALGGKAAAYRGNGLSLDLGPTLLTMPRTVRSIFEALGATDLLPRIFELEAQCTYRFPDGRTFTASRSLEATAASAAAFGPREAAGVRSFYAEAERIFHAAGEPYLEAVFEGMPAFMSRVARRGLSAIRAGMQLATLDSLARRHFASPELQQFVGRFATYTGASPYEASAAFALIPHLERAEGVHHVEGGIGALVDALSKAIRRLGVEVHLGQRATFARTEAGFRVESAGIGERFESVVVNADPLEHLGRQRESLALSGYVMLLEVDGACSLPHHTVLFGADYAREFAELFSGALASDPTVYVCQPSRTDASMAPPGKSGLFVMINAPAMPFGDAEARSAWSRHAVTARAQVFEKLFAADASLEGRVRIVAERGPVELERGGAPGGSIYGFLPHGKLGPFRRPRIRGDGPGLFFAGGGTHPGGGVPLVMLSGSFAAGLAGDYLGAAR